MRRTRWKFSWNRINTSKAFAAFYTNSSRSASEKRIYHQRQGIRSPDLSVVSISERLNFWTLNYEARRNSLSAPQFQISTLLRDRVDVPTVRYKGASSGFLLSEISVPPGFLEIIVVLSPPDSKISVIQIPYKVLQGWFIWNKSGNCNSLPGSNQWNESWWTALLIIHILGGGMAT